MHKNPSDQDIVEVETSKKSKKNNRIKQSSIMMSVLPLAACGGVPSGDNLTFSPNFVEDPVNVFVAVDDNDRTLSQSDNTASLTVTGKAGNDSITTGSGADTIIGGDGDDTINSNDGNDLIRAGNGSDTVSSGAGDDAIVIVGTTAPGQYDTAAITNSAGSGTDLSSLITLADLNDRSVSEVNAGEVIDGGTGTNTLFIYGTVDLTSVTLNNVTVLVVNSDVTLTSGQMALFSTVDGDGSSVLNIEIPAGSPDTYVLDLSLIDISDIASISISGDMTIKIDDADDLAVIGRITNGASDALKVEVSASNAPITINLGDITNVIENVDVIELGDNVVLEITDPADITDLGLTEIEGDGEIDVGGNSAIQNELDTSVTVTIIQSALSIDNISANEAQQASQFTVSLSKPSLLTVTVDYNAPDGSSGTLTFDPGDVQKTFSSTWTDDSTDEVDEVVSAVLSNSQNATISDASGNLTILNDDNPPTISIDDISANEIDESDVFTVSLSEVSGRTVTVDYNAPDGSSGTLTFDPGDIQKTFSSTWTNDAIDEVDEVVSATLSNPTNATILDASGDLTIVDDDNPPTISIDDISANEADGIDTFTVSLSLASTRTITVDYNAPDGSSGTLTFNPGDTQKAFSSTWTDDTLDEADEVVNATLSNPTNATILDASGDLTIVDDDNPPTISIDDISANEADESDIFTVTLSEASGRTVTVDYNAPDGSSGTLTFNAGDTQKTFSSAWTNDTLDEVDEVVSAILSNPSHATISDGSGNLTIIDDDNPPTIRINDTSTSEADETDAFTVSLSAASGKTITVDYNAPDGSSGTLTFVPGDTQESFSSTWSDDTIDEDTEVSQATLSNPTNATISDDTGVLTIYDNDAPPTISVDDVSAVEVETTASFTVSLSAVSGKTVSIDYAVGGGATGTLTFNPGDTEKTVVINWADDPNVEADEIISITLSVPVNTTILDGSGDLTILDDDTPVTINGTAGDDVYVTSSFIENFSTSTGDDTISVSLIDGSITEDSFDGGADYDTIKYFENTSHDDFAIDLANLNATDIEEIYLADPAANEFSKHLSLVIQDVLDVTDIDAELLIRGGATDSVTSTGQGWVQGADQVIDTQTYNTYAAGGATLLIDADITQDIS